MDLHRGARWLGTIVVALGLAAATALAAPPPGDFTVQPSTPNQGAPAVFTCEPCPESATIEWQVDGAGFQPGGESMTTTFQAAGPHTVSLRLTRDNEETVITKTVTVNAPPSVTFSFDPASPLAGQEVDFTSQVTDPEGGVISSAWTFGDGAADTGPAPSHAYGAAGTYTVTLTATDSNGASSTASRSIVVQPDPGPTSSFTSTPTVPDVGQTVTFASTSQASQGSIVDLDWDFDADGQFDDSTGPQATWVFRTPGRHQVRLRAEQTNGLSAVAEAGVRVNGLPSANFTWSPSTPIAGASVDLVSTSTDFEGPLAALSWDLDGDGNFGDGSGPQVRQPFTRAGTYEIGLRVTDSDGARSTVRKQVVVGAPAPSALGGSSDGTVTRRPRLMSPFPIVRIAGTILPGAARISVLSVRAPRGARVLARCAGRGCPVRSIARTSTARLIRFRRFERRLRVGTRLRLFVRQEDRIGKYTSFVIRAGAPPKRVDRCLFPAQRAPRRCP